MEAVDYQIRFFREGDREAVRRICADTGFLSRPIDPLFEDRDLFSNYLTRYYTDLEPESTLVCELNGEIKGYLMGCRRYRLNNLFHSYYNLWLGMVGISRYFLRPYNEASKKYIRWLLFKGWREVPKTPQGMPHFHINLLPEARNLLTTNRMIQAFLDYLVNAGERSVYGQMVTYETRRGERMFARFGFEVLDKVEVTKYREVFPKKIFLYTIVKDLQRNQLLYGAALSKKADAGQ